MKNAVLFLEPDITANELKLKNSSGSKYFGCCLSHVFVFGITNIYILHLCVYTMQLHESRSQLRFSYWSLLLSGKIFSDTKWRTIAAFVFPPPIFFHSRHPNIKQNNFCGEWSWNQLKCLAGAVRVALRRRSPTASCYPTPTKWTWCHTLRPVTLDFVAAPDLVRMQPSNGCFFCLFVFLVIMY